LVLTRSERPVQSFCSPNFENAGFDRNGDMGADQREWLEVRQDGLPEAHVGVGNGAVRIGRAPENQVVLRDTYASGRHAEIVQHGGSRAVRDLGSTNGTRLNGRGLVAGDPHPLRDGDVIQIGDSELTYRWGPVEAEPAASPKAPPLQPKRRSWVGRLVLRLVLALVGLAIVLAGAVWLLAPSRVVVLVMGSDARPDELRRGEVGRTDTMLTVVAERSPGALMLISIPRDLWVSIPGYGEERINTAYALGGPDTAERVAGDLLGVRVERHLLIGLQGVRDIVDAAGGVEIVVDRPIHDVAYPTDDYSTIVVDIPAGRQHMDGETALRYARSRYQDSDFGRMARQQRVMLALRTALMRPTNWWRIPAVLGAVQRATKTDLGPLDLATLVFAVGFGSGEPERLALDLGLVEEFRGGGGAFLLRPTPALRQRVGVFLTPSSAAVEVLNASETAGIATQAADRLRAREVRVVNVGNAARSQRETTVEVTPGLTRAGAHAAAILDLPRDTVRESASLPPGVDVRIMLGDGRR
jgi:LCP family protein required for cell wall assembly